MGVDVDEEPRLPRPLYVDTLIGPDTVNTMPEATLEAFDDHGTVARTVDDGVDEAERVMSTGWREVGIDLDDVTRVLEDEGVASFAKSYDELLTVLEDKAAELKG